MHKNTYIILYENIYLSINKECVIIMIFFTLIYGNGIAWSCETRESEDK